MLRSLCIVSLLLYFAMAVFALAQSPTKPDKSKGNEVQEALVIEQSSSKVKFENDGTYSREDSGRVRIQSEAGLQRYGLLTFSYEDATGTFAIDYVKVHKPDGSVVVTPPENVQDMAAQITREAPFYSDLREKHVAVKGLGVGDVLEFKTQTRITKPLIAGQFWLEYGFSKDMIVLEEKLEISVPRDRPIKVKSPEIKPTVTDAGQYRVYSWTSSNRERLDEKKKKENAIKTAWEQARGRFPQPDVRLSSFQSWEEIGRWYGTLQAERVKPAPDIQAKAAELTKSATDEGAKIRAIYNYVSTQFRYIGVAFGIGRYQPHPASEVLANRYGDCKDKHTLLASLLNAAGIKAYPALISSAREIDEELPSPGQFDHVITVVPQGPSFVWLDTTTEVAPFAFLAPPLRDKHALVIADDKPGVLRSTPVDLPFRSTQTFRIDAKLSESGTLEGDADFQVRGDLEVVLRIAFRNVPLADWKELMQRLSYSLGFGGEVSDVTASSPDKTDEPFHITYKYTRKEYGDWPNRRVLAPAPAIILPAVSDDDITPSAPLWLGAPLEMDFHARLALPQGYSPEVPAAIHVKQDFAEYDATYEFTNGKLISDRRLRTMAREVPRASYDEFKKFRKAIENDRNEFIQLSSAVSASKVSPGGGTTPPIHADTLVPLPSGVEVALGGGTATSIQRTIGNLPDSANEDAMRLERQARDLAMHNDFRLAIPLLRRAAVADPKFTRAWLMLGMILMSWHQTDDAVEAFRKALIADPKQPVVYKILGYSLRTAGKLEDAAATWQEFIKLVPEDGDGPANLGAVYSQLQRYPEAASALESAIKLNPQNPRLQRQLAIAYLRAGNEDKGTAAFRKIVEADSETKTLNSIAYEMAEAGKGLTLALQYAEKAVRAEEERSQKVILANLQMEDLQRTTRLAAYWDTLGWVCFRMSKPDLAEKYLSAAWRLSHSAVIGDHLCQVYEQQRKTQSAVEVCEATLYTLSLTGGEGRLRAGKHMEEMRGRLEQLSPGHAKSENMVLISNELNRTRTFLLDRIVPGTASAEFFVLLVADPKTAAFEVQDAQFISGSEKLKSAGKSLTSVNFRLPSPDDVPTRVVRRGVLGCYQYSGCTFVLLDPSSVRSVN